MSVCQLLFPVGGGVSHTWLSGSPACTQELTEVDPQMKGVGGARRLTPIMGDGHGPGSAAN